MAAATAIQKTAEKSAVKKTFKKPVPLARFIERFSSREDAYKYEWNDGRIEKSSRTLNRDQFPIFQALLRLFVTLPVFRAGGALICEVDMLLPKNRRTRRADVAFLTPEQMADSKNGEPTICPFVIEIISKNDQINEVEEKLIEYFENGVEVVWVIFLFLKQVKIFRSIKEITVCLGDDVCSVAPVLPDFEISVASIF